MNTLRPTTCRSMYPRTITPISSRTCSNGIIYDVQRVAEYAEMMHVSRVTLNNAVVAQFGVSANHLLKQRLLEALKNDLLFTDCTVSQLADKFHFSDPSHLMRFFKQQTGKTCSQYQSDYKNGVYE